MNDLTNNVGIIGQGYVGRAVFEKFKNFYNVNTYDIQSQLSNSDLNTIINTSEIIFICLPTPMNADGTCNIKIVEDVLEKLNKNSNATVVLKSTVTPGSTELFNKKFNNIKIVFNPEFLTERNAINDFNNQKRIILGGPREGTTKLKQVFTKVFPKAHIIKTGSTHAEMVKYFTNCFLACKVSFSNEFFQLCKVLNLDYDKVVEYSILDERLGKSHFSVPGPDGDFGFGGHCFPKDLSAIIELTKKFGTANNVLLSTKKTNDELRSNRDWEKMKGRAIT